MKFIEDELKNKIRQFLEENWIKNSVPYTIGSNLYPFLNENADVLTITFLLQHYRIKILNYKENFETDCGCANKLLDFFNTEKEKLNKELLILNKSYKELYCNTKNLEHSYDFFVSIDGSVKKNRNY